MNSLTSDLRTIVPTLSRESVFGLSAFLLVSLCATGCQRFPWPGSQQAKQFQVDSERLLGEFRAQKKRADDLAAKNQILEQRLADSEKTLARQNRPGLAGSGSPRNSPSSQLSKDSSSRNVPFRDFGDEGLPDVPPSMRGIFTSGNRTDERNQNGEPAKPQWRPVQKR